MALHRKSQTNVQRVIDNLGNDKPLVSDNGRRPPDRRRVSLRWLSGTVLTGVTSVLLMGGALYVAFDGRQQMSVPANIMQGILANSTASNVVKGDRLISVVALEPARERVLQVSTVTKVGNKNVIRKKPFTYASAPLAIVPAKKVDYPAFDALAVFSTSGEKERIAASDVIYSANVEGEVTIETAPFPIKTATYETAAEISAFEAELAVARIADTLTDGDIQTAAMPYLNPTRFALDPNAVIETPDLVAKVTAENVTVTTPSDDETSQKAYSEEVIVLSQPQSLTAALGSFDADGDSTSRMAAELAEQLKTKELAAGTRLRVVWERPSPEARIELRRVSAYRSGKHLGSVAMTDDREVSVALEPAPIPAIESNGDDERVIATVARANLPNVYNGIYRAALSQGLSKEHAKRIVNTVAFDVDFRSTIGPKDELEVFYSVEEDDELASAQSEIVYIGLTIQGVKRRYYRFRAGDDDSVDYYDETGKSAKQFLLRNPVPTGKFRSKFGPRRHPISRRVKMHWGVDFSAPTGTPILAAGNGVVEKAGWSSGYGKQTIIRHANGYKTSYNHQHRWGKGIKAGARVRQGQIIGQVGSTGYSTGPHLHYEVIVNGNKVNPMKIRLPSGRTLKGAQLAAFERERNRIDSLIEKSREPDTTVASL
ncbi:M23 family metallopeptidase [Pseudahrensia aquimaris]|uniref:M23 family metallopeptidase n=1 Tax=Pseudahrensia aquimaris TaxID=744461 RepID=A0ABW3FBK0_9HYPH